MKFYLSIVFTFIFLIIVFLSFWSGYNKRKRRETAFAHLDKIAELNSKDENCSTPGNEEELPDTAHKSFAHSALIDPFFSQHIEPYKQVLQYNEYYNSVLDVLTDLDKYGDCSSVVRDGSKSAYARSENLYSLLSKISLLEHSLNVASETISIVNNGAFGQDADMRRGMLLIAALGHDLGKIPELQENPNYTTGDHPIISQAELSRIMPDSVPERQKILDAVRDHHLRSKEFLTLIIKKADQQARAKEAKTLLPPQEDKVQEHTPVSNIASNQNILNDRIPAQTDLSWMDMGILMKRIEERINMVHENKFSAFSMRDGMVYVMLEMISSIVYDLAEAKNRLEIITEPKRNIEYTVRVLLKQYIPPDIGPSYSGRRYNLYYSNKTIRQGFYMPIKAEAFNITISEMEKRKSGELKRITKVDPVSFSPKQ